jgi:hypothetical protein
MVPWEDISTAQLGEDISIAQQEAAAGQAAAGQAAAGQRQAGHRSRALLRNAGVALPAPAVAQERQGPSRSSGPPRSATEVNLVESPFASPDGGRRTGLRRPPGPVEREEGCVSGNSGTCARPRRPDGGSATSGAAHARTRRPPRVAVDGRGRRCRTRGGPRGSQSPLRAKSFQISTV